MQSPATEFVFDRFEILEDRRTLHFYYRITMGNGDRHEVCEMLRLPKVIGDPDNTVIRKLLESLHIGLGISYYKIFLPPKITHPYPFNEQTAAFWNVVYRNGLGEFLYVNKLKAESLAKFSAQPSDQKTIPENEIEAVWERSALLGIGGGKDSIVGGVLLKQAGVPLTGYVLATGEQHGQAAEVAQTMGIEMLGVERVLDSKIFELNQLDGALNGHVPISMIFAFTGLLLCAIDRRKYLVVNNEAAASIPNTVWHDLEVNHQWSKSFEFEKLLQDFLRSEISPDFTYFSVIRPLSSVAVCKLAAGYKDYLPKFTSCNLVFRIDPDKRPNGRWCGKCAKCLSSYIMMLPWLSEIEIQQVFGADLFADNSHAAMLLELTGLEGHKPLDCVGTSEEMILSLNLAAKQGKHAGTALMELARARGIIDSAKAWDQELAEALSISEQHLLPEELREPILTALRAKLGGDS